MGLIVDTCVLIDAERAGGDVLDLIRFIPRQTGETLVSISAVSLVEMAHGVSRARNEKLRLQRTLFLSDLRSEVAILGFNEVIAVRAGLLDGQLVARGITLGLADLLIGVTALHHDHGVLTSNVRHFRAIPDLEVVEF